MNKAKLKQAMINLEKKTIAEASTNYEEYLNDHQIDSDDGIDREEQSQYVASVEVSETLDDQVQEHEDHLKLINAISFEPTDIVKPGAVVKINGRFMVVAVPKPKFKFEGKNFIGISVQAPIYAQLEGKKSGDTFTFNGKKFTIESVE